MALITGKEAPKNNTQSNVGSTIESPALDWLWKYLGDIPRPIILDCGTVKRQTVDVLLHRGSKVYLADLVSPVQNVSPRFWDRSKKTAVFLVDEFLAELPHIPADSLNAIFCWHLFDLVPRDSLPRVLNQLFPYLQPGGVLFCLLREPYLKQGADSIWRLDSLTALAAGGEGNKPFLYPVLSGRDVERLLPAGNLKSFLTRSGRREVLVLK
jgi:hypothetical protein